MASVAATGIRRDIIYCVNHREASAVRNFLTEYGNVRGLADRMAIDVVAPVKGKPGWRVEIVVYEPFDALLP